MNKALAGVLLAALLAGCANFGDRLQFAPVPKVNAEGPSAEVEAEEAEADDGFFGDDVFGDDAFGGGDLGGDFFGGDGGDDGSFF